MCAPGSKNEAGPGLSRCGSLASILDRFRIPAPGKRYQWVRSPGGTTGVKREHFRNKRKKPKTILRLPDPEVARTSVLQSLSSPDSQREYRHAIDEFIDWHCSESRLAFNRIVVVRYSSHLESQSLDSSVPAF